MSATKVSVLAAVLVLFAVFELGLCRNVGVGGVRKCKGNHISAEIEGLARFAVQEYNRRENGILEFARVLKSEEQVVAGKLYHLTLEAVDGGMKKIYEARIWVKPWMNFKQVQEFKYTWGAKNGTFMVNDNVQKDCLSENYLLKVDTKHRTWRCGNWCY